MLLIQGSKKLEFQLALFASGSHILLAWGHFLLILVNDLVRRWQAWTLAQCHLGKWAFTGQDFFSCLVFACIIHGQWVNTESVTYSAMVITSTRNDQRNINFHTDDVSLSRSGCLWLPWGKFTSTNQKHYPDVGSDRSSVWNFCSHFLDDISQGNQWWHHKISVFSQAMPDVFCFIPPL